MGLSAQDDECKFRHGVNDPRYGDISPTPSMIGVLWC
jgi:hypothetical protein